LTNSIKKKFLYIIKSFGYSILSAIHGKINGIIDSKNHEKIRVLNTSIDKKYTYNIFKITNCRIYTDTVTDTAFILDNKVIQGPSFQHRNPKNADTSENIVFQKGTPKFKKRIRGSVFSLLTGGGGNANYWHWLFDVLPRLKILTNVEKLDEIDYFLFPDIDQKYQFESLDLLNIPKEKRISSKTFRHIETDTAIAVDHPYVLNNDPSNEIQNLPNWIIRYLRNSFCSKENRKEFPKKIYIDRKDAKSNHSHLRKIINEQEVQSFLIEKGYSIISLSDFTFKDQIDLFNNASNIIGLHGAGFANLTFCNPNTRVLELKPKYAGSVIANLAEQNKLIYSEISSEPLKHSNNNQQGLIRIPINLLDKKIS
tara:strand:+ start:1289 stop:2392 length:1104 start_codon:yes stop_codon:yes gene_type:complete